jgi:DNA-binding Xre family transcriptional regulator
VKKTNKQRTDERRKFYREIGGRINQARDDSGMTLGDLARATGINRGQLWKVQNGSNITMSTLLDVCRAINKQPWEMIPSVRLRSFWKAGGV